MNQKKDVLFKPELYREFLTRHDMIFEKPAGQWEQGVPMGNGVIGTMVWGGGERPIRISLDRADIWEIRNIKPDFSTFNWETFTGYMERGEKDNINNFLRLQRGVPTPTRFPVGRFEFTPKGRMQEHTMHFHLCEAVTSGRTTTDLGEIEWNTWVSATQNIIVMEIKTTGGEELSLKPKFISRPGDYTDEDTLESTRGGRGKRRFKPRTVTQRMQDHGYPACLVGKTGDVEWYSQAIPENGGYAVAWKTISIGPGHAILIASISCDRQNPDPSAEAVSVIADVDAVKLYALLDEHKDWWLDFYSAFSCLSLTRGWKPSITSSYTSWPAAPVLAAST